MNDLEGHSRQSELPLFYEPHIAFCRWSVVSMLLSCTVSDILPNLLCTWLPVTLRSPSFSMKQLKLQATCAFWFICKYIVVNSCYISGGMTVRKVSKTAKMTFEFTQGHWCWWHSIGHIRFSISLPLQQYVFSIETGNAGPPVERFKQTTLYTAISHLTWQQQLLTRGKRDVCFSLYTFGLLLATVS